MEAKNNAGFDPAPDVTDNLVVVEDLCTRFPVYGGLISRVVGYVSAVDGVSFHIGRGETFGLVGESGCGKTTVAKSLVNLVKPTSGRVIFDGVDLGTLSGASFRKVRKEMQMVFQDPYGSLDPRQQVGDIVGEGLKFHRILSGKALRNKVAELMEIVGLSSSHVSRYPHEFSGGQRQRICIARAISMNPKLVICDEAVSALDVSVQSQILNLLEEIQEQFSMTYLFIAHGLHVVKHVSDRVGVMYLGKIVEVSKAEELYSNPLHPYTKALVSAIPVPDPAVKSQHIVLEGEVPSPITPPKGCRFHTRCKMATEECASVEPKLRWVTQDHQVACHLDI